MLYVSPTDRTGRASSGLTSLQVRPFHMKVTTAGPDEFDDDARRVCYHDGVASMTAMMTVPPQMHITEDFFNGLFQPNGKFSSQAHGRVLSTEEAGTGAQGREEAQLECPPEHHDGHR
ncbi:hypothetical protein LIX22_002974 (plasmid) [Clavibacter nebraskensis]|uniref:hypothetical protein n=1 Tax=Clavibacter nebraskensis TaxID=31963 RepID=UPI00200C4CD9|nr:hypothetical protein [Clavibacter nebraskensis]UQB17901.1 hypothetical protein LIX22_002974 [Clavibacter nebraskensis]